MNELAEALGASQQNVSKHLACWHDAGIVARRKEGNRVYYRIVDEGVFALCEEVCGSLQRQLAALKELMSAVAVVTTVPAKFRPGVAAAEHPEAVGPIGRLGRWTADHFRAVAIAWVVVAVGARRLRAAGRDRALRRRLAGQRLGVRAGARARSSRTSAASRARR